MLLEDWVIMTSRRAVVASGAAASAMPELATIWRRASGTAGETQMLAGMGMAVAGMGIMVAGTGVAAGVGVSVVSSGLKTWQAANSRLPASTHTQMTVFFPTWKPYFTLQLTVIPPA